MRKTLDLPGHHTFSPLDQKVVLRYRFVCQACNKARTCQDMEELISDLESHRRGGCAGPMAAELWSRLDAMILEPTESFDLMRAWDGRQNS